MEIKIKLRHQLTTDPMFNSMLPENFSDDYNLITSGVLDSLGLSSLVLYIEKTFKIRIDVVDLKEENFKSIESIAEWISNKNEI